MHITDTAAERLLRDLLHPEQYGWAVSQEVRQRASLALKADEAAREFDPARIYIAGPMTGLPDWNRPAFNAAAAQLTEAGYRVWNPVGNGVALSAEWHHHLRADLRALTLCGRLALLPGWTKSKGACLEEHIARQLGMTIMYVEQWLDIANERAEAA